MRTRLYLLIALATLSLTACGSLPNRHTSRITPVGSSQAVSRSASSANATDCDTTTTSSSPLATGSHGRTVDNAYRAVLRDFMRPLDSTSLLDAAWQGAENEVTKEGAADPGVPAPRLTDRSADADWDVFSSSYDALSRATDGHVDQVKLAFSAVAKMAASVNEGHTFFLEPEAYNQEAAGSEASISGIGVELNGKNAPFVIEAVVSGSPADQVGLKPGDTIVAVDGCDVNSWDSQKLTAHVRGPAGTPVRLTLDRPASGGNPQAAGGDHTVDITRAHVTFPDIDSHILPQGIGYVHLHGFPLAKTPLTGGKTIGPALRELLSSFQVRGAKGWILDLRGDPGGSVDGLQVVAGIILPPGTIFSSVDRRGNRSTTRTTGNRVTDPPLIAVLVDGQSASAAEILSQAVQDEGVASVVGSTTAGVANAAILDGIGDGAGLSITHFQTESPKGRPLNGTGLRPDIQVEQTAADLAHGVDPPLNAAVALAAGTRTSAGP